jgi:hypothetical protein
MKNGNIAQRSCTRIVQNYEHGSEAAIVFAPFLLGVSLIGFLPWIAG